MNIVLLCAFLDKCTMLDDIRLDLISFLGNYLLLGNYSILTRWKKNIYIYMVYTKLEN